MGRNARLTLKKAMATALACMIACALVPFSGAWAAAGSAHDEASAQDAGSANQSIGASYALDDALDCLQADLTLEDGQAHAAAGFEAATAQLPEVATAAAVATPLDGPGAQKLGSIARLASSFPLDVQAASGMCGENITWSYADGVLTLSGSGDMVDIASSERRPWDGYKGAIVRVVVTSGITSIGNLAFFQCSALESVSLPSSVTKVGSAAFAGCSSLASITLPSSVTEIDYAAFADCSRLAQISMPGVTSIGEYAFQNTALTSVCLPSGLTSLAAEAFFRTPVAAFSVEAGNAVFKAIDGVLYADNGATLALYPSGSSATTFAVPAQVSSIGNYAFSYAENLESVDLGSVAQIGEGSFAWAQKLSSVRIPDSVTEAGNFAFYECPALTSVAFGAGLASTSYEMFEGCASLARIDFGGITALDARSFCYCSSLESVTLPASVKSVGNGCFGECTRLKTVTSLGLEGTIAFQTFLNCWNLESVQLNEGVERVARVAFLGCDSLASITLPRSCSYVDPNAFPGNTVITCLDADMRQFGGNGYRHLQDVTVKGECDYAMAYEVLDLVNAERASRGLSALTMDETLLETAMQRAVEQSLLFSHTRPDGSLCFTADASMVAENVAVNQKSADDVMDSWMNSEGHRANILDESHASIGVGCFAHDGVLYWVQVFGDESAGASYAQPSNKTVSAVVPIATETFSEATQSTGVVWGDIEEYTYEFSLDPYEGHVDVGSVLPLCVRVANPGFGYVSAKLENAGITWSSSEACASVSEKGEVTGICDGETTIKAALKYYEASTQISVGVVIAPEPFRFVDVDYVGATDRGWAAVWITEAFEQGLMSGYKDPVTQEMTGWFGPADPMTRAQAIVVLYRAATGASPDEAYGVDATPFSDVAASTFYTNALNWAYAKGYVRGYSEAPDQFRPNNSISRQELALMLWRVAGEPYAADGGWAWMWAMDAGCEWEEATPALQWSACEDILSGSVQADGSRLLNAYDPTERCQAAKIFVQGAQFVR